MQTILAIDTCTEVLSVCLHHNNQQYLRFVQGVEKSSGLVLNYCDEVLSEAQIGIEQVELITYTKGPGAFTGVRMCVAVAQGMAYAHNIPTLGLSTLEVVGYGAAQKFDAESVAVALDARMSEVYWGVYQQGQVTTEALRKPNEVDQLSTQYFGVGTGWGAYEDDLKLASGVVHYQADFYPSAEYMIELAQQRIAQTGFDDKLPLPTYLRNNVAQKSLK